jgi:hypothetical protein
VEVYCSAKETGDIQKASQVRQQENRSILETGTHIHELRELLLSQMFNTRGQLKCDGTRAETRFRLSAKRTSPFKSAEASVQSTAGSRGVRISSSNAGYTVFQGSVRVLTTHSICQFPSLSRPCVCHHISTGVYYCVAVSIFVCTYGKKKCFVLLYVRSQNMDQQLHFFF